jgi:4-hydroxy-tetrahydrodipicolinate synthase
MTAPLSGILAPVVTPFTADLLPDADRLVRHCRWLLSQNCGLAVFGTNSEANSLSVDEKIVLLDALMAAGLDGMRMMPGTGCCALPDTVRLTAHAVNSGCAGVLMLPPFYYKGVSDDGLFRSYSEVIQRVGDSRLRIYLYHFPQMSAVPLSLVLIERLIGAYPDTVVGIKDSSGDWNNTHAMLQRFPGWGVFAGSESRLVDAMRHGARGCISATCNINAPAIAHLAAQWRTPEADALQAACNEVRTIIARFPMIAALKSTIARLSGDPEWTRVRPPLMDLTAAQAAELAVDLDRQGFSMPGLP